MRPSEKVGRLQSGLQLLSNRFELLSKKRRAEFAVFPGFGPERGWKLVAERVQSVVCWRRDAGRVRGRVDYDVPKGGAGSRSGSEAARRTFRLKHCIIQFSRNTRQTVNKHVQPLFFCSGSLKKRKKALRIRYRLLRELLRVSRHEGRETVKADDCQSGRETSTAIPSREDCLKMLQGNVRRVHS
jgi:hypothetical protein